MLPKKGTQIVIIGKKISVDALYRGQDWEFKAYDIHEKVLRWFKLPNTYKIYEI